MKNLFTTYLKKYVREIILDVLNEPDINKELDYKKISMSLNNPKNLNTKTLKFLNANKRIDYIKINFEYYDRNSYIQKISITSETIEEFIKKAKSIKLVDVLKSIDVHFYGVTVDGEIRDYIGYEYMRKRDYYDMIDDLEKFIKENAPEHLV